MIPGSLMIYFCLHSTLPICKSLKCKSRFYAKISKILIPSLYNSYYLICLYVNWIYTKYACMQKNLQEKLVLLRLYENCIQLFSASHWLTGLCFAPGLYHSTTLNNSDYNNALFLSLDIISCIKYYFSVLLYVYIQ